MKKKGKRKKLKKAKPRDEFMVRLINGATKSGVQKDRRKENNKKTCREKIEDEQNEKT